jgi:hypothetical protein
VATRSSDAVLRRMREATRDAWREERRPGGSYELTARELIGLRQICARLRGKRLGEREQFALARMMCRLLDKPEPVYGLIRKPLAVFAELPQR